MMASYSVVDALNTVCTSIPEWETRLDELHGQIASRQAELARLEYNRPSTPSLKNKGSTESLRPKDNDDKIPIPHDTDNTQSLLVDSPKPIQSDFLPRPPKPSSATRPTPAVTPPPEVPSDLTSNPRPSPNAILTRQSSQPTPPARNPRSPALLRKRKTESLASGESLAPKFRTRSMIIVYYDSAVQTAFEDLVKFVSGSRNAMRKGKMAAKMAEMRKAAEREVEQDVNDDEEVEAPTLLGPQNSITVGKDGQLTRGLVTASDSAFVGGPGIPQLRYPSMRMGQTRDFRHLDSFGATLSVANFRGYRRSGLDGKPDIFDELDKALEWCQSQCEHAAHQFLRDGECSTEIDNIKRKLGEVEVKAKTEMERRMKEEALAKPPGVVSRPSMTEQGKSRTLKTPHMRRDAGLLKELEVDDMEVDDEGVDDMEPPQLIFKRSRDITT